MLEINSGCSSKILHVAMKFSGEITSEWTQNTHSNINMSFSCQHKIMRFNDWIESQVLRQRLLYTEHFFSSLIIKVIPWRNSSSKHYRQINKHCIYMTKILQRLFFFYLWISSLHFTVWFQFQNSYVNMISMKLFVLFLINQLWSSIYLSEKWIKLR